MKRLYVLFDQECGLCRRCREWLLRQPNFVELVFIPLQSPEIARRFPGLREWPELDLRERLVVISDEGLVYQGQNAWIMTLFALRDYRAWAQRLADPALRPYARRACEAISRHRLAISRFLNSPVDELVRTLSVLPTEACTIRPPPVPGSATSLSATQSENRSACTDGTELDYAASDACLPPSLPRRP